MVDWEAELVDRGRGNRQRWVTGQIVDMESEIVIDRGTEEDLGDKTERVSDRRG